jgi:hypothetical protein
MQRRDIAKGLLATASGAVAAATAEAQTAPAAPYFAPSTAEVKAGVTPTFTFYTATPRIDPRRYGAVGNGTTDDTNAMQTALKVAQAGNGRVAIPDDFVMLCGPLSVTVGGLDSLTTSFAIEGASMVGSRILAKPGITTPLLTIKSSSPVSGSIVLQPAQVILESFSLANFNASTGTFPAITQGGHGLSLQGVGGVRASALQCVGFDAGVQLINSLGCLFDQQGQCDSNNYGFLIARQGTNVQTTNLITLANLRISANKLWGVSFNGGTQFVMRGCDVEANGTSGFTTTGALQTGADLAGTNNIARIELYENWFEANYGTCIAISGLTAGLLSVAIEGGQVIGSEGGNALVIGGANPANQVLIKNVYSPGSNDEWQVNATYLTLINTMVGLLADNVRHKSYINSLTAAGLLTS